jgi:hypothetical protein
LICAFGIYFNRQGYYREADYQSIAYQRQFARTDFRGSPGVVPALALTDMEFEIMRDAKAAGAPSRRGWQND